MQPFCVCCQRIFPRQSVGWLAIHHSFLLLQHTWHWVHCLPSSKSSQDRLPMPLAFRGAAAWASASPFLLALIVDQLRSLHGVAEPEAAVPLFPAHHPQ